MLDRLITKHSQISTDMAERIREEVEAEANSPAKKLKLDQQHLDDDKVSDIDVIKNWNDFKIKRVLNNNVVRKQIWLEGTFKGHEKTAIVSLEKKSFPDESGILNNFFDKETMLNNVFDNDAYASYACYPPKEHNGLKTTVIYPATPKHLEKCKRKELYLVEETPELHKTVTIPQVIGTQFSVQWVQNILDHKAEFDRIIYEDTDEEKGFVLIPDLKWDGSPNTFNALAISRKKITCIRELNESHLPLLRNIRDAGIRAIVEKYDVPVEKLRVFFHYLPSYYHLHVHFAHIAVDDAGVYAEKAHLLSSVISNVELMGDYYQKAVLTFAITNSDLAMNYRQLPTSTEVKNSRKSVEKIKINSDEISVSSTE